MKSFPEPMGSYGVSELRFYSPQPDPGLHCNRDNEHSLLHHAVCLFTL